MDLVVTGGVPGNQIWQGVEVNVSYTANPDGFVGGGARNVTLLITLFSALAILVFVIVMLFKPETSLSQLMKFGIGGGKSR